MPLKRQFSLLRSAYDHPLHSSCIYPRSVAACHQHVCEKSGEALIMLGTEHVRSMKAAVR